MARTSWRWLGSNWANSPGPPLTGSPPGSLSSTAPLDDDQPGALVDLVLVECLAGGKLDRDRATLVRRDEHLGLVRLDVDAIQVPGLHARGGTLSTE